MTALPGISAAVLLTILIGLAAFPALAGSSAVSGGTPAQNSVGARSGPYAADARCHQFGFDPSGNRKIPVAWPLIMDLTEYGTLKHEAVNLSDKLAEILSLTGAFQVNTRDRAPVGGALSWISPIAFNYLGWRSAGNWMVVTGTISPVNESQNKKRAEPEQKIRWIGGGDESVNRHNSTDKDTTVEISLSTYLTEEGNVLEIANAAASIKLSRINEFAVGYINAVSDCVTGLRSSAGSRIVYARKSGKRGMKEIWVTSLGSDRQVQVSEDGTLAMLPAWGPGGSVAWTGYREGNPDIYVEGRIFGKREGLNTGIAWAPDGTRAAVTWAPESAADIYLVDPSTGRLTQRLTRSTAIDTSPAWSPDSSQIAFVSDRNGTPSIFVMNADGSDLRKLPLAGEYNTGPDWSPDGSAIVYQSRGAGSRFSIRVFDIKSQTARKISRDRSNNEEPSWSPDGRFITYTSTRKGEKKLYIMNRNGSGAHPIFTDDAEYFTPAWERTVIPARQKGAVHGQFIR